MTIWTAKDPDAVWDYLFTIPLDEGDTVVSHTFTKLSGDVVIDDETRTGADIVARLSGGTDGETAVFRATWVTTAGREDDEIITLFVNDNAYVELLLTGYMKPQVQHLTARYPAFVAVEPTVIAYWLTDAERFVDNTWMESDYAAALMALAAHNMASAGLGADAAASTGIPAGITSMKSGTLSLTFSDAAAKDRIEAALSSTRYGAEFAALLRRNKAGPRVMGTGSVDYGPYVYPMGDW